MKQNRDKKRELDYKKKNYRGTINARITNCKSKKYSRSMNQTLKQRWVLESMEVSLKGEKGCPF